MKIFMILALKRYQTQGVVILFSTIVVTDWLFIDLFKGC